MPREAAQAAFGPRARSRALLCAVAIAALAVLPRFVGLEVGGVLEAAHPDEFPVALAQWKLSAREVTLQLVAYGGGYHTPLHLVLRALGGAGIETVLDPIAPVTNEKIYRYLIAMRAYSAALSTAAVAIVFSAGRAVAGVRGGAIAALILAAAPAVIRDAHLVKADAAATCAAALVIAALAHLPKRSRALALALGGACGLAITTKYLVGMLPAAALAAWQAPLAPRESRARRVLGFGLATAATAAALSWFFWFEPRECWRLLLATIDSQYDYVRFAWIAAAARSPFEYHAMVSLRYGCGGLAAILAGPAVVAALARAGAMRWVAVAVLGQLGVVLANPLVWSRNLSPILPGLAVAIGALVTRLADRIPGPRARAAVTAIAAAALVAAPGWDGLRMARAMAETDTRGLAASWIAANVPAEAVLVGFGGPSHAIWGLPDVGSRKLLRDLDPARWSDAADFAVLYRYPIAWASRELPPGASLGTPLVVFDPFAPGAHPVVEPLDAFYLPLARFAGVARPGPRIEIYRLKPPAGSSRSSR